MILKSLKYIQNIYKSSEWKHAIVHQRGQTLNLKWITQHCRMIMSLQKGQTLTKHVHYLSYKSSFDIVYNSRQNVIACLKVGKIEMI